MPQVFFGSPRQSRLDTKETLPGKLDLILERLHLRDRVKGETVALKMHTGNHDANELHLHPEKCKNQSHLEMIDPAVIHSVPNPCPRYSNAFAG